MLLHDRDSAVMKQDNNKKIVFSRQYKNQRFSFICCPAGCSGSDRSLEQGPLVDVAALLENGHNLLDVQSLREHFFVLLEQVVDPTLGLGRQSAALSSNYVSVEVENSELWGSGDLLVLDDELFDVLAALEEFLAVLQLEDLFRTGFPLLTVDWGERTQGLRVDFYLVLDLLGSVLPVGLWLGKSWYDYVVIEEDVGEELVLVEECRDVDQVLVCQTLTELGHSASHLLDLLLSGSSVHWNKLRANLHLAELLGEASGLD